MGASCFENVTLFCSFKRTSSIRAGLKRCGVQLFSVKPAVLLCVHGQHIVDNSSAGPNWLRVSPVYHLTMENSLICRWWPVVRQNFIALSRLSPFLLVHLKHPPMGPHMFTLFLLVFDMNTTEILVT
jgi:hypothetical protein